MKNELNLRYKIGHNEIDLFRDLADILKKTYRVTFIEETHKHIVKFKSKTIGQDVRREISDLWIIMYSPVMKRAKMTFLQAKFKRTVPQNPFTFDGEYFQYELLSQRPKISCNSTKFNFPNNILSYAIQDSIATYGVFFKEKHGTINLAYSTATLLKPNTLAVSNCQTVVDVIFPNINSASCILKYYRRYGLELAATMDIDCFTQGLLNLLIGSDFIKNKNILIPIRKILLRYSQDLVVRDFLDFISSINPDSIDDRGEENQKSDDGLSILLINTDEQNVNR